MFYTASRELYMYVCIRSHVSCVICFSVSVKLQTDNKNTMASLDGFPASFYGEPGVLGILSNGISAFLVLLQNFNTARTGIAPVGVENILAGKTFKVSAKRMW